MAFRRFQAKRPIHSIKHIVDQQGALVGGTPTFIDIANAVDAPVLANKAEVETGSSVNALFVNIQVTGEVTEATLANVYAIFFKNPGNNIAASAIPDGNVTGVDNFKRQIFHTEMAMLGNSTTTIPVILFKGVLKVPKVFKNMRVDDFLSLQLFSPVNCNYCVQMIYKEYR